MFHRSVSGPHGGGQWPRKGGGGGGPVCWRKGGKEGQLWAGGRGNSFRLGKRRRTPPPRDLLEQGGGGGGPGEGGRGSKGDPPPPPCRNIPNLQGTEKLLENEQLSTWKCHVVGRKQRKFIIECQFRVPTSHQYTTTTTQRDIHHLMPNDSDLSCQSALDSPEPEPPSLVELELEPDDDDKPESLPEWETSDKLSDSASSSTDSGSEGTSAFCLL